MPPQRSKPRLFASFSLRAEITCGCSQPGQGRGGTARARVRSTPKAAPCPRHSPMGREHPGGQSHRHSQGCQASGSTGEGAAEQGAGCQNAACSRCGVDKPPVAGASGIQICLRPQSQAVEAYCCCPTQSGPEHVRVQDFAESAHPRLIVVPRDKPKTVLCRHIPPITRTRPNRRQGVGRIEFQHRCGLPIGSMLMPQRCSVPPDDV